MQRIESSEQQGDIGKRPSTMGDAVAASSRTENSGVEVEEIKFPSGKGDQEALLAELDEGSNPKGGGPIKGPKGD